MKIHIVGSGAIGGMAGWHMAKKGEEGTFVDQWLRTRAGGEGAL